MKDFLSVDDLNNEEVYGLIRRSLFLKETKTSLNLDKSIVNMFFENSTRTKHSFEMSQKYCNMHVMNFDAQASSIYKGESLYDSVLTMEAIGVDIAVIRHEDDTFYEELKDLKIKIVNAGSGKGAHPSQSLLDMMTIYEHYRKFEDLNILIVGDILHSRVAMSNMKLLHRLGANIHFYGPMEWFKEEFLEFGERVNDIDDLQDVDVVMLHRIQLERHDEKFCISKEDYYNQYGLTPKRYETLKDNAIVLHPAPVNRGIEIDDSLVEASKSKIYEQMRNGVYMRMAILEDVVEERYA